MVEATGPRVVLVETSDALPGLLPYQAWDAVAAAPSLLARDARHHPSAAHLEAAGIELSTLEGASLERRDLDLTRPGDPDDRRLAKALVERARTGAPPVFLLGPDDDGLAAALAGMAVDEDVEIELVFFAPQPRGTELLRLVEVMRRLRDPDGGCPWDLEQDHESLVRYLVEETYELLDAIENGGDADLREELGDVLLQVLFHAQVADDRRAFAIDDVARGTADKLIHRHPHVFADGDARTAEDVMARWDQLKDEEKGRSGPFDGVPGAMPGLQLLETLQRKLAGRGVAAPAPSSAAARLVAALDDFLDEADGPADGAVGELFALVVGAARRRDVEPETAARRAATAFREQAERVLALARRRGVDPAELDSGELQALWDQARGDVHDR